jgi:hypothetical protein
MARLLEKLIAVCSLAGIAHHLEGFRFPKRTDEFFFWIGWENRQRFFLC